MKALMFTCYSQQVNSVASSEGMADMTLDSLLVLPEEKQCAEESVCH